MLNYALNKESSKTFVMYYKDLGDDNYTVYYGSGDSYPVPKSKENEQKLLEKMEEQVLYSETFYSNNLKEMKIAKKWLIYDFVCLGIDLTLVIFASCSWIMGIAISCFVLGAIGNGVRYLAAKKNVDDADKNRLFIKNKEKINYYLDSVNDTAVYSQTMNPVRIENPEPAVTINDVHTMTYKEVRSIVNNIQRDEALGIDRSQYRPKMLLKSKNRG